jgi:uncharacterized protein
MLGIDQMSSKQIHELLPYVKYAHLDCVHQGKHYVMPVEYYIADSDVYLFTTEGVESKDIDQNPEVCLQVEDIHSLIRWRKAIINGRASRLTNPANIDQATHFIEEHNSRLLPANNRTWADVLARSESAAIYRFHLGDMSGRTTQGSSSSTLDVV